MGAYFKFILNLLKRNNLIHLLIIVTIGRLEALAIIAFIKLTIYDNLEKRRILTVYEKLVFL